MRRYLLAIMFCLSSWPLSAGLAEAADEIVAIRIADVITPVMADYCAETLAAAEAGGGRAFLIELDTPGGLDTAMRRIIQSILGARIPVIVYVTPAGARAASAGALITLAADFAAMAPGTNLGAAHPVSLGVGMGEENKIMAEKIENDAVAYARSLAQQRGRNVEWAERMVRQSISTPAVEAQQLKVVDLIAADRVDLLRQLDGRSYLRDGQKEILHTAGLTLREVPMNWRQQILAAISNPTVAYLLLILGVLGIFFEISQPGVILPGAVGALALLLSLIGLQTLPVNYVGVLLILLALVLFLLEIKIVSYGMLTVGGIVAMAAGSLVLIDSPLPFLQVSRAVIFTTVGVAGLFCAVVLWSVSRSQKLRPVSGAEGLVGTRGEALTAIDGQGSVLVAGEIWQARATEPIGRGEAVEVLRLADGLLLEVRKVPQDET